MTDFTPQDAELLARMARFLFDSEYGASRAAKIDALCKELGPQDVALVKAMIGQLDEDTLRDVKVVSKALAAGRFIGWALAYAAATFTAWKVISTAVLGMPT